MDELGTRWHYLIGDPGELAGVWRSYYVGVTPGAAGDKTDHTSVLYFIDKQGNRRVLSQLDLAAEDIARNALLLAKQ